MCVPYVYDALTTTSTREYFLSSDADRQNIENVSLYCDASSEFKSQTMREGNTCGNSEMIKVMHPNVVKDIMHWYRSYFYRKEKSMRLILRAPVDKYANSLGDREI